MPYMETILLPSGRLTISLDVKDYVLNYRDLVIYENGKRTVRGRTLPYAFRSIEQMRYDFENDIKSL